MCSVLCERVHSVCEHSLTIWKLEIDFKMAKISAESVLDWPRSNNFTELIHSVAVNQLKVGKINPEVE